MLKDGLWLARTLLLRFQGEAPFRSLPSHPYTFCTQTFIHTLSQTHTLHTDIHSYRHTPLHTLTQIHTHTFTYTLT